MTKAAGGLTLPNEISAIRSPEENTIANSFPTETAKGAVGDKDILFGRGKSIQERGPNIHLRKFVDVFKDNYYAADTAERHTIVKRIVEILQNDGYSFRKPGELKIPSSVDGEDENDEMIVLEDHSSWVVASSAEVQKKVMYLFQRCRKRDAAAAQARRKQQQEEVEQQQQQQQQRMASQNDIIAPALDSSSVEEIIDGFTSPESSPLLSSSQSPPLPPSPLPQPLSIQSFLLPPVADVVVPEHDNRETQSPPSARALKARSLLEEYRASISFEQESALPRDGILWAEGTRNIRLLDGMDESPVPIASYSLFPKAANDAFGKGPAPREEESRSPSPSATARIGHDIALPEGSRTIGYTEQKVGNLTILRPIVLLTGVDS